MVVDSGRMAFFFGAGASAEFGIPLMRKMGEDFKSIINKQDLEEQEIYNEIVGTLKDDMGPDVDIEAIFSVIDGLQDYNIENIGELSIYISKKFFKDTPLGKNIASKAILQSLKKDFQRSIRRSCALESLQNQNGRCLHGFFQYNRWDGQAPMVIVLNMIQGGHYLLLTTIDA